MEGILGTLLLTLKFFLSVEMNFWIPSKITFKNLGSFQGECLWRSSVLVKPLSLSLLMILILWFYETLLKFCEP